MIASNTPLIKLPLFDVLYDLAISIYSLNDTCNGISMLLGHLISGTAPCFHDVRTYWSPEACERVTGQKPDGVAANGFIHLINSGATALDGTGACVDEQGDHVMKPFWKMTEEDIRECLDVTDWCRADYEYFRGGGYSSHFRCIAQMPVTMLRLNIIEGIGPVLQIAEGWTAKLPEVIHHAIDKRTDANPLLRQLACAPPSFLRSASASFPSAPPTLSFEAHRTG